MLTLRDSILIFGSVILACGSLGLLAVRLSNPLLRGLGWLGGGFTAAGAAAVLFTLDSRIPAFWGQEVADLLVVLCFVLVHVAILELVKSESLFPTFGACLLGLQVATSFLVGLGPRVQGLRIGFMGLLVAAQSAQTAWRLYEEGKKTIRVPAWFCASIMVGFVAINVARSVAFFLGLNNYPTAEYRVDVATFAIYIAVALGVAFSFFWMTTSTLTEGLERMANTDPLTRLFNRRVFLMWCEKELKRSRRNYAPCSILMIDLDHFKQINATYGHDVGDAALCVAVERMQASVRGIDVLGRWGGEEFVALLPNADPEAALVVAERVRANVSKIRMPVEGIREGLDNSLLRLTVSVGVTTFEGGPDSLQAMLRRADTSLYQAKAEGRNRVLAASAALSLIGV